MAVETQNSEPFNPEKTYTLAEVVRGSSPLVNKGPDNTVFAFPVVALLEVALTLGTTLLVFIFSLLRNAPLEEIANPNVTTNPAKAPWYFVGLQELLEHMHPLVAGVILPTVLVLFLMAIPYLDNSREGAGRWFTSARGKRITWLTALYTLVAMSALIVLDNTINLRESLRGVLPDVLAGIVLPAAILALLTALPVLVLWRWRPTAREVMLSLFTVLIVSAVVFTLSGFLFRGPGFKLFWPWAMPGGYNPLSGL